MISANSFGEDYVLLGGGKQQIVAINSNFKIFENALYIKSVSMPLTTWQNASDLLRQVTVVNGTSTDVIPQLHTKYDVSTLDFVFMDHFSKFYKPDLQKLEKDGFLHSGSVVFADNINGRFPGSAEFSDYLNEAEQYECKFYECDTEYRAGMSDGMLRGIYKRPGMFSVFTEEEKLVDLQDEEQPK